MAKVLIKRDTGDAFFLETTFVEGNPLPGESGMKLSPNDVVDGKKVSDWPTGVFTVQKLEVADGQK